MINKVKNNLLDGVLNNEKSINRLLKEQEKFLDKQYADFDELKFNNKRLTNEVNNLTRILEFNDVYINYLTNSFYWKLTLPLRIISRKIKNKKAKTCIKQYVQNINEDNLPHPLDVSATIIIHTNNASNEFELQLKNLINQRLLKKIQIIVIDHESDDKTLSIAKKYKADIINIKNEDDMNNWYNICYSKINGDYIVLIEQNVIVKSQFWLYQSILPIEENDSLLTAFLRPNMEEIRNSTYYFELKNRIQKIANYNLIFFPKNRDSIQYITPVLMRNADIIIKKKDSNKYNL